MQNTSSSNFEQKTVKIKKFRHYEMKAAVIAAPAHIELQTVSMPEPKAGQVRIRMQGCGMCASNLPVWEGRDWFDYPQQAGSPGHEGWGVIDAVGEGVRQWKRGDRVAAISFKAFAEYDITAADQCVALPDSLSHMPFPGEPLACAMNIFARADIRRGQTVAIIGCGFLGTLLVQLAKNAGARVIALSRRESSLQHAQTAGADELLPLDDHWQIIEKVKSLTNDHFCHRVIEATGKSWPLDLAGELTAVRGKLVIAGFHQDGLRKVNVQLWNWRGLDVINAHERDPQQYIKGLQEAIKAVEQGILNPEPLFTHHFSFKNIHKAFEALKQREEGFVKAWVSFEED